MTIAKMLNLGSGRTKFPGERPAHHALVPETIYAYPEWFNISRNASEEPDCVMDLFTYPWALESNAYEGALVCHLAEHIPHEIRLHYVAQRIHDDADCYSTDEWKEINALKQLQDAWFCFFSELYRVLKPGAMVHILSPHAWSTGAMHDPSHTRYLLPETFNHSMQPDPNAPFEYANGGLHFEMRDYRPGVSPHFAHLVPRPDDPPEVAEAKLKALHEASETRVNVISEFYVKLEAIK